MHSALQTHNGARMKAAFCAVVAALMAVPVHSQSVCSSDSQAQPPALFERFINADCEICWSDPNTPTAAPSELALDWIVPSPLGDEAALSSAASRDALLRLESLRRNKPVTLASQRLGVSAWPGASLRVAHGVAFGGYLGASIALTLPVSDSIEWPLQAWLVLVETLPLGVADSPVSRNLVRNVLQTSWNKRDALLISEQMSFEEMRALNIPEGANPQRLRVVGWVQDASGQIMVAAQSACQPED